MRSLEAGVVNVYQGGNGITAEFYFGGTKEAQNEARLHAEKGDRLLAFAVPVLFEYHSEDDH